MKSFKDDYNALTDKEKSNFESLIVEALSFVPIIGPGVNFVHSISEYKENNIKNVLSKIMEIDKPANIDDSELLNIGHALKQVFSEHKLCLAEYASIKKDDLKNIILDKYNENKIITNDSPEIKEYINKIIDRILENIDLLENQETISKTALRIVSNHEERLSILENEEVNRSPKTVSVKSDSNYNHYYIEAFNRELFLECQYEEYSKRAKLSDVYIEPIIKNCNKNILYDDFIDWCFGDSDIINKAVLVLGKAGIGKTSLIADIVTKYEKISILNKRKVYTVMLRNCIFQINNLKFLNLYNESSDPRYPFTAWKMLQDILSDSIEQLDNSIIILDGLDELSVLINDFDVSEFISELTEGMPSCIDIKLIMTSREGYFEYKPSQNLSICELLWDDSCVKKWCEGYKISQPLRTQWCTDFPIMFEEFENETIKEIISCPIILYMMCFSEIRLSDDISRARIYNKVFGSIGKREHDIQNRRYFKNDATYDNFKKLIKEISFVVSVNDGSYGNSKSLDVNNSIIKFSENKIGDPSFVFEENKVKFFGMFYFASESDPDIYALQVAHRSVFEYFAALKIYEDFFKSNDIFLSLDEPIETWRVLFKAFRYRCLEYSIFEFLKDIIKCENKCERFREEFFQLFCNTLNDEYLLKVINTPLEYNTKEKLYNQFDIAFSNIFNLLEVFDFYEWTKRKVLEGDNDILSKNIDYIKYLLKHFSVNSQIYIKPQVLYLENIDFKYGDISGANMSLSLLNGSDLSNLSITNASFSNAELREINVIRFDDSDLSGADLRGITKFKKMSEKITFRNCNLGEANLQDNDLDKIQFENCNLNYIHISLEQKEYILKNIEGNLIEYVYVGDNNELFVIEYDLN